MTEILTITEINERYPDEWVLIGEPETDESLEVLRGKVLYHGKSRDEMYQAASALPDRGILPVTLPANVQST